MSLLIDTQALKAIAALQRPGKPDLVGRVVQLFISESPKAIAAIEEGLEDVDLQAVRNAAHTLKSSSAYVGAKSFSNRCGDLEAAAREDNFTACIVLGDGLDELFVDCCAELTPHLVKAA